VCTLRGHTGKVVSLAFSPDGKSVVSGSADKYVKIWDAETGADQVRAAIEGARCEAGGSFGIQEGTLRCLLVSRLRGLNLVQGYHVSVIKRILMMIMMI